MTKYLHSMIRVTDPDATIAFFKLFGVEETRRFDVEAGRFTLIFLAANEDEEPGREKRAPLLELTYNWDPEPYDEGRHFGHLAYAVDDIYETCQRLMDAGVTINRPPRDGHMAFIRSPDNISIAHHYGLTSVLGDATQTEILEHAGIDRAAVVVLVNAPAAAAVA